MSIRSRLLIPTLFASLGLVVANAAVQVALAQSYWNVRGATDTAWAQADLRAAGLATCVAALTLAIGAAAGVLWSREGQRAEARLREAQQAAATAIAERDALLASLGHDFRTPLNGVLGSLQLLADEPAGGPREQLMDAATKSSQRLASLVEDLLERSQPSAAPSFSELRTGLSEVADTSVMPEPHGRPVLLYGAADGSTAQTLRSLGRPVEIAADAAAAEVALATHTFDLVVVDAPPATVDAVDHLRPISDARGTLTAFVVVVRPRDREAAEQVDWDEVVVDSGRLRSDLATLLDRWLPDLALAS
ncbi:MAG: histidine kinase dimerization/phospho-acceptor domain-containing protein [Myxococcota bacterium]